MKKLHYNEIVRALSIDVNAKHWDNSQNGLKISLQRWYIERGQVTWSMTSYYNMITDYFFSYGPIPPGAI
jgi:hypothetical protein